MRFYYYLLLILLLSSCGVNNFLKQRYTHFKHSAEKHEKIIAAAPQLVMHTKQEAQHAIETNNMCAALNELELAAENKVSKNYRQLSVEKQTHSSKTKELFSKKEIL